MGENVTLKLRYDSVPEFHVPPIEFNATIRDCVPGELKNTILEECIKCSPGTYSFDVEDDKCTPCPIGKA